MLALNLTPIFKMRGINKPYSFLVKAGLSPHSATSILNNELRSFRLDHIELLCHVLICEPNDLLIWIPEKGKTYPENYPLSKLKQEPVETRITDTLSTMTYKELKDISKVISEIKKTE